jgi:hypothetical protein
MKILWVFIFLVLFCIYVLFGLHLTEGLTSLPEIVLNWIVYTIIWVTMINIFALGYFWSVVKDKSGPSGLRGPIGERGEVGLEGQCSISVTAANTIKTINEYLDALYKSKTNNNILDTDIQTFPNTYLNDKIRSMASSKQFQSIISNLTAENKSLETINNYLKSIWKIWFDLIFDATSDGGIWFTDEFGDEEYTWSGSNPFDEIKKYDIYYWGVTSDFRPLKAEICRTTPLNYNAKLPVPNKGLQPQLKVIESNDYDWMGSDNDTRGSPDATFWRARSVTLGTDVYYPIGDIVTAGNRGNVWKNNFGKKKTIVDTIQYDVANGPKMRSLLVTGDVKPAEFDKTVGWTKGKNRITNKKLKCPQGYVALGDAIQTSKYDNSKNPTYCLPKTCVEKVVKKPKKVWEGLGVKHYVLNDWRDNDETANGENGYNLFRHDTDGSFYKIKKSCLQADRKMVTKDVEPEFGDLGIGWYGHPYKLEPQYSIFTFLGLVPEGLIVHQGTGRRFYIVHYGGEEANIYNVLDFDDDKEEYKKALQVDSNKNGAKVVSRPISRSDSRQQWKIVVQSNKKLLKLQNIMNGKTLYLGIDPTLGDSQFSTVDLTKWKQHPVYKLLNDKQMEDGTTFTFISTFGTNIDILDKQKK